jgi:hypothetical protein
MADDKETQTISAQDVGSLESARGQQPAAIPGDLTPSSF